MDFLCLGERFDDLSETLAEGMIAGEVGTGEEESWRS